MVTALLPASASAQRAIEDAPGHALVPQPPGSYITQQEFLDYGELAFPAAAMEGNDYPELLEAEGARVIVNAILFAFDSDEILPESAEALATVAELLDTHEELKLLVVGHLDSVGDFDYNLRLSLDRAAAVVAWLRERHGIAASRLRPAGAGRMSPVTPTAPRPQEQPARGTGGTGRGG